MAIALFAIPARSGIAKEMVLDWETCKRLPWDIVLLMGGGEAAALCFPPSFQFRRGYLNERWSDFFVLLGTPLGVAKSR